MTTPRVLATGGAGFLGTVAWFLPQAARIAATRARACQRAIG